MNIYCFNDEIEEVEFKNVSLADNSYKNDTFYWFDLSVEELCDLNLKLFKFDRDTIEECKSISQLAKVIFYDDYTFMVLNSLKYENGIVNPDEFNVFFSKKYVITISKQNVKIIDELKEEIFNLKNSLFSSCEKSSARLVYYILDKLILNDYEIINKLENCADTLEIHIIKNPNKQFLNALLHLRHQVHTLRRCITPLRYIGDNLICNDNKIIEEECLKAYSQINSKIDKLIFSMESLVSYIALVREAFEAEIANKTNEIMKLFTIVSMFFSPLMLITGIYNMNFNIPEYKWRYGYIYVLALMLSVCAILYRYFKKKGWL